MSRGFALCIAILLTTGCNPDKQTRVDQDKIVFATDDASRLFFKNVRKIYYELEVMEAAKFDVYRHKQRELSTDVPVINLAIVDNWRYDEAYLLLEPNELLGTQGELALQWELGAERGKIVFRPGNKAAQVAFADKVYHRLQLGCSFKIQINDTWIPFLDSDKSREAFRITMFDYYGLVKRI